MEEMARKEYPHRETEGTVDGEGLPGFDEGWVLLDGSGNDYGCPFLDD